jgi:para-nitrobenzyl esterase
MKIVAYVVLFSILAGLLVVSSAYLYLAPDSSEAPSADDRTLRSLESGETIGFVHEDVATWLGIPFATAPVGDMRWRATEPFSKWEGRLEALEFETGCPQLGQGEVTGNEDCLFLNVWSPNIAKDEQKKRPVMFWIHGGGNSVGDASTPIYHGDNLSRDHDLVVVSIQYRLGPMGWFRHPALRDGSSSKADQSGNFGTLDIVEALKWVRNNIEYFGGDPENVTIFGESAGAFDVLSMMASPLAKGLFAKAISQSGGLNLTTIAEAENYSDAIEPGHRLSSREIVNNMLIKQGLAADRQAAVLIQSEMAQQTLAKALRDLTPAQLLGLYGGAFAGMLGNPDLFADGHVLPQDLSVVEIFSDVNLYNAVPVILGTNRDETKLFTAFGSSHVDKTFGLPSGFKDLDAYNRDNGYSTDSWKIRAVDELATAILSAQGDNVYAYRFDVDDWHDLGLVNLKDLLGAAHALEIPFVFNKFIKPMRVIFPPAMQEEFNTVSDHMSSYWSQFAYTGSPGTGRNGNMPAWSSWNVANPESPRLMIFDTQSDQGIRMVTDQLTRADLKRRFLAETTFSSQSEYCEAYQGLFNGEQFDTVEYERLGENGCVGMGSE